MVSALLPAQTFAVDTPPSAEIGKDLPPVNLAEVRDKVLDYMERMHDTEGPYGSYRQGLNRRTGLYASCDVAIMRTIMGEDLTKSLSEKERTEWINHINSYQQPNGLYTDTLRHAKHHANGMVISALGALGGRQKYYVTLYDELDTPEEIVYWLENKMHWPNVYGASHLFWGGPLSFSFSKRATSEWLDTTIKWLDENADPKSGWWRKDVEHTNSYQGLGGGVHIYPIYEHNFRRFPYPERVIDSVLAMQSKQGNWLYRENQIELMSYLDLDALYALQYCSTLAPNYRRDDIDKAVDLYGALVKDYWRKESDALLSRHPHISLAAVGTFALLQQLDPEEFYDDVDWTGIFSDHRFYMTADVEVLPEK